MSPFLLAAGRLIVDAQGREGAKGSFTTATLRANGDEAVLISVVAFGDQADRLLEFAKGDAVAVSGRARLTSWTSCDGTEKHGLSLVAEQIAAKPRPKSRSASTPTRPPARGSSRSYLAPRLQGRGAELLADRVDDLWRDGLVP